MYKGIDVSKYQGNINWEKVKNQIDFAILKAVSTNKKGLYIDPSFERNYNECKRLGIPVGAYYYTYATDTETAEAETNLFLKAIKGKTFEYPLVIDVEDNLIKSLSPEKLTDLIIHSAKKLERNNLYVCIYTYLSYAHTQLQMDRLTCYDLWIAHYAKKCKYTGPYGIWQYSSEGNIEGINGNVDLNISYKDYSKIIKYAGLNGYTKNRVSIKTKKSSLEIAKEILKGIWGNGEERKNRLKKSGYNYDNIQIEVNKLINKQNNIYKPIIKKGDTVKVLKAINYDNNKPFKCWLSKYIVLELNGNRAVIGTKILKKEIITSAIHINNIIKI